ncbi:hypothetical protein Tco_0951305 [Tanacetum coccineum]|uniref:Uncharacterized protein n=1 Tax=Tanacetum coccineum TaxID=301880 RepID=A0ABQ5DTQ6_9ASTR
MVSPLNPMRCVVNQCRSMFIFLAEKPKGGKEITKSRLLISGRSLTKQCSYRISEDAPPSTYISVHEVSSYFSFDDHWSFPFRPSSLKVDRRITVSDEKLWAALHCLCCMYAPYLRRIHSTCLDPFFPQELPLVAEP